MTSPSSLRYDTYYHLYNRGVNRENIFFEERNYAYFLNLYWKHIGPVVDTFAYCLLRNHFHFAIRVQSEEEIETLRVLSSKRKQPWQDTPAKRNQSQVRKPLGSDHFVSTQFSNFFNAYAKAINKAYNRTGSLFQHPFGRVPIKTDRQFWNVIRYIHQNPQKHKFVKDFRDWEYSSYGILLTDTPTFLEQKVVLDWFGGREEYHNLHADWVSDAWSKWFAGDDFD
jgi:putative transposase